MPRFALRAVDEGAEHQPVTSIVRADGTTLILVPLVEGVIVFLEHLLLVIKHLSVLHTLEEVGADVLRGLDAHTLSSPDGECSGVEGTGKRGVEGEVDGLAAGTGDDGVHDVTLAEGDSCVGVVLGEMCLDVIGETASLRAVGCDGDHSVSAVDL